MGKKVLQLMWVFSLMGAICLFIWGGIWESSPVRIETNYVYSCESVMGGTEKHIYRFFNNGQFTYESYRIVSGEKIESQKESGTWVAKEDKIYIVPLDKNNIYSCEATIFKNKKEINEGGGITYISKFNPSILIFVGATILLIIVEISGFFYIKIKINRKMDFKN